MTLEYFLQVPDSVQGWEKVAEKYESRWQLPHCCGALDGKHISIVKPHHSGSMFFNYKGFFSIVLMALVDADCNFIYIDVGAQGRVSDGGVYSNTTLAQALERDQLHFPPAKPLHHASDVEIPYFIVGDDAFPMKPYLMKPYSRRNLSDSEQRTNYRLSRGRRTSENAFGILSNVFRVFHTPMNLQPDKAAKIVRAACVLHNFIRKKTLHLPAQSGCQEDIGSDFAPLRVRNPNCSQAAKDVREHLKEYFCTVGAVPWQDKQSTAF